MGKHKGVAVAAVVLVLAGLAAVRVVPAAGTAPATAGGLSVFVGYAEDKETTAPDPATFPVPWAGSPNTTFLGGTVPGQAACGTLTTCYDAGAIRLDNPGPTAITVNSVSVDDHSSLAGGQVFPNLWGSFSVPAGQSVILTENPPANNPGYDNFDTSGFPSTCTPITVPPTVTLTIGGSTTTLVDSTHALDSGGTDAGSCSPKRDESVQWRPIGAAGSDSATLTLGPPTTTAVAGQSATETATLLDGSGAGIPNAVVDFAVTSGPDAGTTGTAVTDHNGHAAFTYAGAEGEDVVSAGVTTVGTFHANTARVLWTDDSATGWTGSDIGHPTPAGSQSLDAGTGTWTVAGGGTGISGPSDQFHYLARPLSPGQGVGARVASVANGGPAAQAGVMLRSSADPAAPFYAALASPAGGVEVEWRSVLGGPAATTTIPGSLPSALWVTRSGTTLTAYMSSDGFGWTPVPGSPTTLDLGTSPLGGLAVSSDLAGTSAVAVVGSVVVSASLPPPGPPVPCPSPFSCADIGNPTPAGSQSFDPGSGTWTVMGGGTDITGTSDQFRFVSQPISGDGSVRAHVTSQSDTSTSAKAGVMLRASTDPASPYYAVLVSPGTGVKVQERSVQGGNTTKLANPAGTVPDYLEVTRVGATFTASTSTDGVSWTPIAGSSFTMSLGATLLGGLAVTSHNSGQLGTVTMDTVSPGVGPGPPPSTTSTTTTTTTTTAPPPSCPSPYACADIGNPTPAGSELFDASTGTWTIAAGGADITGTSDQFRFVYQSVTGDTSISAQVTSQSVTSTNAKAGVMLRVSTDPASPYYGVMVTPGAGVKVQVRTTQGGTTTKLANPAGTVPTYLQVDRVGNTFSSSTSTDGVHWTPIAGSTVTLALSGTLLAGLAVTSHHAGQLGTATFDTVS